ncbi:MAG: YggS family pyridoxal phosphate-dependent enzyme [Parvibaculales bacterium]
MENMTEHQNIPSSDEAAALARLDAVRAGMAQKLDACGRLPADVTLIAVSKTFPEEHIRPVLAAGHRVFGENRVQESEQKWPALKAAYPDVELHLIGALQSKKTAQAVALFDAIHSLDREKLAAKLADEIQSQGRHPHLFVQVNTGDEPQKAGIGLTALDGFVDLCRTQYGLTISGLMCLPPVSDVPAPHFALLQKRAEGLGLPCLSMGMSADFEDALAFGATHVRLGTAIFGPRTRG